MVNKAFNYHEAFSRNIGWVTPDEQGILRSKRIAIAGLGGVGGSHLITLTRLGVGKFNISDMDTFGVENFNRQAGASMETVGQPKLDVLHRQAQAINPELDIRGFPEGVTEENVDAFLEDVDLYVDSLDFFAIKARRLLFSKCTEKGIPAITAAPLGMGCAYLGFLPGKMTFEQYFRLDGHDETEQLIRFLVGLAPARLQNKYLVHPHAVDIPNHKGPSTPMAIETCAGIAGTEALKILLHRGKPIAAPWGMQFDAFRNKLSKTWRPWGNGNAIQQIALAIGRKKFGESSQNLNATQDDYQPESVIEKILDLARWAPSGDNSQPWRFEIIDDHNLKIRVEIEPDNPYEYRKGEPTIISTGMLIESIRIAASQIGLGINYTVQANNNDLIISCALFEDGTLKPDELYPYIKVRSVDRNSYSRHPLNEKTIAALANTLHPSLEIVWHTTLGERLKIVKLNALSTDIRLRLNSCYQIHTEIVDWESKNSTWGVPADALGLDKVTLKIMQWAMTKWERMNLLNNYLGGTLTARLQMDLLPGINCAAHFAVFSGKELETAESILEAGASLQRFWLTATQLGLVLQPGLAPLCFANRSASPGVFGGNFSVKAKARKLSINLERTFNRPKENIFFMGRIGQRKKARDTSRSLRLPLSTLTK